MKIIQWSIRNFCRKKKNTLLCCLTFMCIALSMMICQTVDETCQMYRSQNENPYSEYYRVVVDRSALFDNMLYDDVNHMWSGLWTKTKKIHAYFLNIIDYTVEITGNAGADIAPVVSEGMQDYGFEFYGITDCMELSVFVRGEYILKSGRYLNTDDRRNGKQVCMISEQVALQNDLHIGDNIHVEAKSSEPYEMEIVGIYQINMHLPNLEVDSSNEYPQNRIFVPVTAFEILNPWYCYNYQILVDDTAVLPEIEAFLNEYSLFDGCPVRLLKVSDIYAAENNGLRAIERAFGVIHIMLYVISLVIIGTFTLSIMNMRKREMGVYLALGESKNIIWGVVVFELFLCFAISFIISVFVIIAFGAEIGTYIITYATGNITSESLRNTTADFLIEGENAIQSVVNLIDAKFLYSCVGQTVITIVSIYLCSVFLFALRLRKLEPMFLMRMQEDIE